MRTRGGETESDEADGGGRTTDPLRFLRRRSAPCVFGRLIQPSLGSTATPWDGSRCVGVGPWSMYGVVLSGRCQTVSCMPMPSLNRMTDASHTASTYTLPTTTGPGPSGAGRRSRHRQRHWLRLRAAWRLGAWVGRSIEGLDGVYMCKRYVVVVANAAHASTVPSDALDRPTPSLQFNPFYRA